MQTAYDLHHNIQLAPALAPVAIGTTGTGKTSKVIDRKGFGGVEFIIGYGAVTATNATIVVSVQESDVTGSGFTSAVASDLLGTPALAGIAATTPRASGVSMNLSKKIGYIGKKRYVQVKLFSTVTAGPLVSVEALLNYPRHSPTL